MSIQLKGHQIFINGRSRFIYSGDFSYGRAPRRAWCRQLELMKQAGLNCVNFYCVWRFHEPQKDIWDFSGNHDIAALLDLISELGMFAIFRMGPFVHGEYRNGGFPDWLRQELGAELRTNSPRYLERSKLWYHKLLEIAKPRLVTAGGPIILIQMENELGSSGCKGDDIPRGSQVPEENRKHLEFYCSLLRNAGIDLPVIDINKVPGKEKILGDFAESGGFYPANCFGSDGELASFKLRDNHERPMISIETGGGMFVRFFDTPPYRNTNSYQGPIVKAAQIEALAQQTVAEGANGVGFFLFNDGQHLGDDFESMLPRRNMNFQAPLTCVGSMRESYYALKRLGWFVRACEAELVNSIPNRGWALVRSCGVAQPGEIPETGDLFDSYGSGDCDDLALKTKLVENLSRINPGLNLSESNFIFMRNVSNRKREWLRDIRVQTCPDQLACECNREFPCLVQMELPPDKCKIMPFFLHLQPGCFLTHSTGTLLDRRAFGSGSLTVLHATREEFTESCIVTPGGEWRTMPGLMAVTQSPNTTSLVGRPDVQPLMARQGGVLFALISEKCAGEVWEISEDAIAFSDMQILNSNEDGTLTARTCGSDFYFTWIAPQKKSLQGDFRVVGSREYDDFNLRTVRGFFDDSPLNVPEFRRSADGDDLILEAEVTPELLEGLEELVLRLEFDGDAGEAWLDDELISDHYYGRFLYWEIGLKDWLKNKTTLKIRLRKTTSFTIKWQPWRLRILNLLPSSL